VWAILCTLFCCLPFGIVAIVYSSQVNGKLQAGDVTGAMDSSRKARNWCLFSLAGWFVMALGYAVFFLLFMVRSRGTPL